MRSLQRAIQLWLDGYTFTDICKKTRLSKGALLNHRHLFPERDWVRPSEVGVWHATARSWADRGLLQRSPSGLFRGPELVRVREQLKQRVCVHAGCDSPVQSYALNIIACPEHRQQAVDPDRILRIVREQPGVTRHQLFLRVKREAFPTVFEDLVRAGLIEVRPDTHRAQRCYIREREEAVG